MVRLASGLHDHIQPREPGCHSATPELPKPPPQTIAGHRVRLVLGYHQAQSRVTRFTHDPNNIEVAKPPPPARLEDPSKVTSPRQTGSLAKALRLRQRPPCFVGTPTVSRFRPFFRRRDSTALPHRVAIRARKPCRFTRFRFRGRYVGCIAIPIPRVSPES